MSLVADITDSGAVIAVRPDHGNPVTFVVEERSVQIGTGYWRKRTEKRYVTALKGSGGFFTRHVSFEAACKSALTRARRYERAYSVPRGIARAASR